MNLLKLSWKYLIAKPFSTILSLVLVALGVSLTSILLLINNQFQDRLYKNIDGINLVIGAKGSPLQMILSSVYHIDVPTGNIKLDDTKWVAKYNKEKHRWLTKNKFLEKAIPLALGDSYEAHRIVGTDHQYSEHYNAKVAEGKLWDKDMEVTVGALAAKRLKLKIGDTFHGSHGVVGDGSMHIHETYAYEVVGIFEETNTVLDQLIMTNVSSVWRVHEDHDHDHEIEEEEHNHDHGSHDHSNDSTAHAHDDHSDHNHDHGHSHDTPKEDNHNHAHDDHGHDNHDHAHDTPKEDNHHAHDDHDHGHDHNHDHGNTKEYAPLSHAGKEVTAYLIQYKKDGEGNTSAMAATMLPKIIDETEGLEELGYAVPAFELQRLLDMTGVGMKFLRMLSLIIIIISAFSVFISLYSSLKERRYEIALMRVAGASRGRIFTMIILEGLLVALLGFIVGIAISHIGMSVLAGYLQDSYQYSFSGAVFLKEEAYLFVGSLLIGFFAAVIPALQAYKADISETLSNS
ncbi:MAG: ABC transporter permease [Aureispira sp.]|nr:ABC transporter permease [Aureispira sp.]